MSKPNKTNEWSTITSALPDYCRKFVKLSERGKVLLQLEKGENGEWRNATPVNESDLKLEEQIKALQIKLEEAKKLYVNN